jgi:hypothetical protein
MANLSGRQLIVIISGVLVLATLVAGIYGLAHGPDETTQRQPTPAVDADGETVADPPASVATLADRSLPHTDDPVAYARAVATSLFGWDTSAGFLPTDYAAAVLADADPSGEETPGLVDDVSSYLPTRGQWLNLGAMAVAQSIDIESAVVPTSWAAAVQQAHGQLRPGTAAITITGTRHRTGVWNGDPVRSSYPVSFTVFVACAPSFERCHVLRLSQLDNPLR